MAEFNYTARDPSGASRRGVISAQSRSSAASQLRERGWIVVKVDESRSGSGLTLESLTRRLPPRGIQVEVSLQQMAMMLRSGMTLLEAIESVAEQAPRQSLADIWNAVGRDLRQGKTLTEAMERHKVFPSFVIRLVKVGERTGNLPTVLARASETMKHRRIARESFVSATIYPVLVLLLSVFVTGYMVVYLIPRLETYLTSLGREMPPMTQNLIDISYWVRANYQALTAGMLLAIAGCVGLYFSPEGRLWIDRWLLRTPVLGRLVRLGETATFARGLSMMLKSGITVTDAMMAVQNTLGNYHLRQSVAAGCEKLIRGSNLADAINQPHTFTPLLRQMVIVGEKSGDLAGVLEEVSTMSDQQLAAAIKRTNAIVTPALTLGIGGVVGYVYIAFFMALVAAGT